MNAFNLALHEHLIALGFAHQRLEADWEDTGDAENGPELSGGPALDLYQGPNDYFVMTAEGEFGHEIRDLELETHLATMDR